MFNLHDIIVDYRRKVSTFLKNVRFTHSELSVWIHCDRQKKPRSTEEMTEKTKAGKDGESKKMTYSLSLILAICRMRHPLFKTLKNNKDVLLLPDLSITTVYTALWHLINNTKPSVQCSCIIAQHTQIVLPWNLILRESSSLKHGGVGRVQCCGCRPRLSHLRLPLLHFPIHHLLSLSLPLSLYHTYTHTHTHKVHTLMKSFHSNGGVQFKTHSCDWLG